MFTLTNKTLPAYLSASEQDDSVPLTRTLSTISTSSWTSSIKNIGKMSITEKSETPSPSTPVSKYPVSMCGDPSPGSTSSSSGLPSSSTASSAWDSKASDTKDMSAAAKSDRERASAVIWAERFDLAQKGGPLKVTDPYFQNIVNKFREEQKIKDQAEKKDRELKAVAAENEVSKKNWMSKIGLGRFGSLRHR